MAEHLLWSGGMDSTFLLLDRLARGQKTVAHYACIMGAGDWHKDVRQREAMDRIIHALPAELRAHLDLADRLDCWDMQVWNRWCVLYYEQEEQAAAAGYGISPQVGALAAFQEVVNVPLLAGYVRDDMDEASPFNSLWLRDGWPVEFPLMDRQKADLVADARARGFDQLLEMTWTCDAGANADAAHGPCGKCQACQARIIPVAPEITAAFKGGT